ncbi:eukaryotic translation initiation factor 4 gamma 1-like isoform X2 [Mercenaria mercenaria]|uniref:eukaryotic translation initiation factor 4 gamma 1-like isoform X2 n=1 Tax=Mercenaria mercenaria TaxID=6596 RepID=UPI001E1E075F|nr:eukaryotic translation initiation factor 4 gamma 1-like isoform X2 [Mercenaria mercenaria]
MLKNETKWESGGLKEGTSVDGEDKETKILGLKYKYAKGQWSPLHPEGKKHYDREFLLQFQNDYNAIQKPSGLPDIPEISLDNYKPLGKSGTIPVGIPGIHWVMDFTPKYVWGKGDQKQTVDMSAIQLGPGSSAGIFSGWGRDSTDRIAGKPAQQTDHPANAAKTAVSESQSVDCCLVQKSRGYFKPEPQLSPIQTEFTMLKVLSEEDVEKKTEAILHEYFATQDIRDVILCVQELTSQNHHHFVCNAINHVLERSSQARIQTGHILHDLVKLSVISLDSYIKGLSETLKYAEDLEIDIPMIWQYYGELISPMIQSDSAILSFLKYIAAPLIANNKAGILLAEILDEREQSVDASSIQKGSGSGRFSSWGWGSTRGNTGKAVEEKENPNTRVNRPDEHRTRRFGGVNSACGGGRVHDFGMPTSLGTRRFQALEPKRAIGVSQSAEGGHTKGSSERAERESEPAPAEFTILSEKDMEKKTKSILDEYFAIPDRKVVILCVQELSTKNHHHFVYNAINLVLERSSQARKQTGHILHDLVKQSVISVDNYIRGLVEVLEFAEDMEKDSPEVRQYFPELISPMIQDNSIPLSFFKQAISPLIANNKAGVLLAENLFNAGYREELYKKTRSLLNKLTPQKFQSLVPQMQTLPIDSENQLKGVIDLVFEKAVSAPSFSVAYANMCYCLMMFKVQSESKPEEMVSFRAVLVARCQMEFMKDTASQAMFQTKREKIQMTEDDAKKEELRKELQHEETTAKQRSLAYMRFIGDLFKLKMLTENSMHDCVFKLLRTKDPENLECLCRLLTSIGKELDVDKAKPRMDQYFQQMGKIVNEKKTPPRVRFMLQDVMDLRTNLWRPLRVDDIQKARHNEVVQEEPVRTLLSQQNQLKQWAHRGGRRGGPPEPRDGADGWNPVGANRIPLKFVDRSIGPSKMKLSKQSVEENAIQLGTGGGASRFSGWGRGRTAETTGRPSQEKEKRNTPANRFSALRRPDQDQGRRFGGVSPARSEVRGFGVGTPSSLGARRSPKSKRKRAVAAAKVIGANQSVDGGHRTRCRGRAEPEPQPSSVQPASTELKVLSEKDIEKKTKAIFDEYFAIQNMKEAILCVQELSTQNHYHFVYNAINHVLERSSQARKQTGHILHDLVKQTIISVDNYIKGLVEVLEFAEDLEIDIPKIWQYYGELISPMIQDNSVPLSFLKQAAAPLIPNNKAGVLLAEILHDASHREGHMKVAGLWTSSGLQWLDFVPKHQVEQFLKDQGLEYTSGGDSAPITLTTGLPLKEIDVKLHELIVQNKADNETVFDWIKSNVDDPTTRKAEFIRALMTAVCYSAIKGDKGKERLEPKEISARNDLLQKYLDHQTESELQSLYAVQALIAKLKHPQGVLQGMFDTLYDEDIISEDTFFQWEKSEEEPEGKDVCLKQTILFFTWLREAEEGSC